MEGKVFLKVSFAFLVAGLLAAVPAMAQPLIGGKVEGGNGPIAIAMQIYSFSVYSFL